MARPVYAESRMRDEIDVVPYDAEKHGAWVVSTFLESVTEPGGLYATVPWSSLRGQLAHWLAAGRCQVATVKGDGDAFAAWAITGPAGELVYAYTKFLYRRMGLAGILTGASREKPVGLVYWTRAAMRLVRDRGYRLYHVVSEGGKTSAQRRSQRARARAESDHA